MADLENWMSLFRDKLHYKTYDFIFQTLVAMTMTTSRLQLMLLTSKQIGYMFSKDLALGAKALLIYHVDLYKDESSLPTRTNEGRKEVQENETLSATKTRKVSLTCTSLHVVTNC